MFLYGAT